MVLSLSLTIIVEHLDVYVDVFFHGISYICTIFYGVGLGKLLQLQ